MKPYTSTEVAPCTELTGMISLAESRDLAKMLLAWTPLRTAIDACREASVTLSTEGFNRQRSAGAKGHYAGRRLAPKPYVWLLRSIQRAVPHQLQSGNIVLWWHCGFEIRWGIYSALCGSQPALQIFQTWNWSARIYQRRFKVIWH